MPTFSGLCPLLLLLAGAAHLHATTDSAGAGSPTSGLTVLPPGITLPVELGQTLHAGRTAVASVVTLRTTQRIPLGGGRYLPAKTTLSATVAASTAHPATLALQPTSLTYRGVTLPLRATVLAIGGFVAVSDTAAPAAGSPDRGNPSPANWTTAQLGGDQIMRSGWYGPLVNATTQTVGSADPWGVYTLPSAPGDLPHALGPFSADARGLFGYPNSCQLRANTVRCTTDDLTLRHGDTLLLQTLSAPELTGSPKPAVTPFRTPSAK